MRQVRIGDITIDAVIEREGPWRRPQDFFPAYDEAIFKRHLPAMEPEVFDQALGMMVITYQTFVVRTPRYTILVDTCTGEDKGHPPPFDFPGKERWRKELFALGISYAQVDYVFCTHLHIDHTGWNTTLRDGRWVPTFPNGTYIFHKREYAAWARIPCRSVAGRRGGARSGPTATACITASKGASVISCCITGREREVGEAGDGFRDAGTDPPKRARFQEAAGAARCDRGNHR